MSSGTDFHKQTDTTFYPSGPLSFLHPSQSLDQTPTEGVKHDQGKPPLTLIPGDFLLGMAEVFQRGAVKYGRHNFRKGLLISRTLDAALRHLLAFNEGEDLDPETNLNHLFHAACSLAMTVYNLQHHSHLDDRPPKG